MKKSLHLADDKRGPVNGFFTPGVAPGPMRCAESRVLKLAGGIGREWYEVREQAPEVRAAREHYPDARLVAVADGASELWTSVLYCSLFGLRSAMWRLARRNIMNLQCFFKRRGFGFRLPAAG